VYDVTRLLGRKSLIFLKENTSSFSNIQLGNKVVVLSENEAIRLAPVGSNRLVIGTKTEFVDVADPFDIVTEFPQVVDRRLLDVFVSEDTIPYQSRTSSGSVVKWSCSSTADSRWRSMVRISLGWSW